MKKQLYSAVATMSVMITLFTVLSYAQIPKVKEVEERLLKQAAENIEKYRKGDVLIRFKTSSGEYVRDAKVTVRQKTHDFLFGCLLNIQYRSNPYRPELFKQRFKDLFNYATVEMYWGSFVPRQGMPRYPENIEILDWCGLNGITVMGHALVWCTTLYSLGVPSWLPQYPREVQAELLKAWVINMVGGYKGQIDTWDVLNESTNTRLFSNFEAESDYIFEPVPKVIEYADKVFRWAYETNPEATLVLNEFGIIADIEKRERFAALAEGLKSRNTPVTALGIQAHEPREEWYPPEEVWETFDTLSNIGYPLYVTELHVQSSGKDITGGWREGTWTEEAQSEFTEHLVRLSFGHPAVQCINWHGLSDRGIWLPGGGLIDEEYNPKPVYTMLMKLVHEEWKTNLSEQVKSDGAVRFRGFYGNYDIILKTTEGRIHSFDIHVAKNEENRWVFTVND